LGLALLVEEGSFAGDGRRGLFLRAGGGLLGGAGLGEAVGVGAGLDDVVAEDLAPATKNSLEAIATLAFSARSVRTWKRSSAPRRSSSVVRDH
jgi:hypothetical protein